MRVAAFQFDVRRGEVAHNLARVEEGLREAAEREVALVLLPEMWATSFVSDADDEGWLARSDEAVDRVATYALDGTAGGTLTLVDEDPTGSQPRGIASRDRVQ